MNKEEKYQPTAYELQLRETATAIRNAESFPDAVATLSMFLTEQTNHLRMFKQMLEEFEFHGLDGNVTRTGWSYREEARENEMFIEPAQPLGSTLRFYFDLDGRLIDMVPRTNPMNLHC